MIERLDIEMKQKKTFSFSDAKKIVFQHREIKNRILELQEAEEKYNYEIKKATEHYSASEVLKILKEIPIEEVNRDRKGIRVKALRENGFTNYADVFTASMYQISAIRGISEDGAYRIKYIVSDVADTAAKTTKLKLSADNRTPYTTKLVMAVSKYQRAKQISSESAKLYDQNKEEIEMELENIQVATSFFRWIFASSEKKQLAIESYEQLQKKINNKYGEKIYSLENENRNLDRISDEEAWDEFQKQPIRFTNILENTVPGMLGNQDSVYGLPEQLAREVQDECFFPDGLLCELRRYQEWGS